MQTRDVSKDVANVVEFYRLVGRALAVSEEPPDVADALVEDVADFLDKLDKRGLIMLIRGLTHIVVVALTPDSQITLTGPGESPDPEDRIIEDLVRLERLGEQTGAQLLTYTVVTQLPLLAPQVATGLALPIAHLVHSGQVSLDGLTSKGE